MKGLYRLLLVSWLTGCAASNAEVPHTVAAPALGEERVSYLPRPGYYQRGRRQSATRWESRHVDGAACACSEGSCLCDFPDGLYDTTPEGERQWLMLPTPPVPGARWEAGGALCEVLDGTTAVPLGLLTVEHCVRVRATAVGRDGEALEYVDTWCPGYGMLMSDWVRPAEYMDERVRSVSPLGPPERVEGGLTQEQFAAVVRDATPAVEEGVDCGDLVEAHRAAWATVRTHLGDLQAAAIAPPDDSAVRRACEVVPPEVRPCLLPGYRLAHPECSTMFHQLPDSVMPDVLDGTLGA